MWILIWNGYALMVMVIFMVIRLFSYWSVLFHFRSIDIIVFSLLFTSEKIKMSKFYLKTIFIQWYMKDSLNLIYVPLQARILFYPLRFLYDIPITIYLTLQSWAMLCPCHLMLRFESGSWSTRSLLSHLYM